MEETAAMGAVSVSNSGVRQCIESCTDNGMSEDFVNNNPSAFNNAYFDFQWLKIYD